MTKSKSFKDCHNLGDRRELWVDDLLLADKSENIRFELHNPIRREIIVTTDKAWEGNECNFITVLHDPLIGKHRLYYRGGYHFENGHTRCEEPVICLLESTDGISWRRVSEHGLKSERHPKGNNVVVDFKPEGPWYGHHGFSPFIDSNPKADPAERYKAIGRNDGGKVTGLFLLVSPDGVSSSFVGFYNTMFMWPMLVFGYENFMMMCLDPEFERIMDEFAEINRRVFRAFARLPVNFAVCHDDIVLTKGPVCSPEWMRKFIFPRYEEFWDILKKSGKEVVFMADGCMDVFVDDVMACGARGIISEPFTDFKSIARRYENCVLAGEGDNRILNHNNPAEIRKMVESMVETGRMSGGYMMSVGNHIPFNTPPEAVKTYLDLCGELAYRN